MADTIKAKQKLEQLATRVKGTSTSYAEDLIINRAVDEGRIKNRSDIKRQLCSALNKTASEVDVVLANDDSDRLTDEIVSLLDE
jgi:hypothetical protein